MPGASDTYRTERGRYVPPREDDADRRAVFVDHPETPFRAGRLSTMYWIGLQPRDRHLNLPTAGWTKHAVTSHFTPWVAEATGRNADARPGQLANTGATWAWSEDDFPEIMS